MPQGGRGGGAASRAAKNLIYDRVDKKVVGGGVQGKRKTYSAKAGAAGKDLGKRGKNFAKIAKSAKGGAKVAGAILKKLRAKKA